MRIETTLRLYSGLHNSRQRNIIQMQIADGRTPCKCRAKMSTIKANPCKAKRKFI